MGENKSVRENTFEIFTGNEAFARGALEAGVGYCAAYPGTPSSEILEGVIEASKSMGGRLYAEWSINEKVALEGAAAASFAGIRALCSMKSNGLNVASDFFLSLGLSGTGPGGLVVLVCDDPEGYSSTNEEDSRGYAVLADVPLLEPGTIQEAKDIIPAALKLSEEIGLPCLVRSVTRISHARGKVSLGVIDTTENKAFVDRSRRYISWPSFHPQQKEKMRRARELVEDSPFNKYQGAEDCELLIVTSGTGWLYSQEAVKTMGLGNRVGILKLGTTWPLPEKLLVKHLAHTQAVLFVEEIDIFLERNVAALAARHAAEVGTLILYGKENGFLAGPGGPAVGEMTPDIVMDSLGQIFPKDDTTTRISSEAPALDIPERDVAFCPGCPHRASFWAMKVALEMDGRKGFVVGDIGCYSLAKGKAGYNMLQTLNCMGAGVGLAGGFGRLRHLGFSQPVINVIGDSTFYHAGLPGLVNARYNKTSFICAVLDNGATAMTGFQPHPGIGITAMGEDAPQISIESIGQALGIPVGIQDPFQVEDTIALFARALKEEGVQIIILRQKCALVASKHEVRPRYYVDQKRCTGDSCGCARFCARVFACPANVWDDGLQRARIDEVICNRCGVCVQLCPRGAIKVGGDDTVGAD